MRAAIDTLFTKMYQERPITGRSFYCLCGGLKTTLFLGYNEKMIDIKLLREKPEEVKKAIATKQADPKLVDDFLSLDDAWRKTVNEIDLLRAKQKRAGDERKIDEAKKLKEEIKNLEENLRGLDSARTETLKKIPNLPLDTVPIGKDDSQNITLREVGKKPAFDFPHKNYLDLANTLGIIDTDRAGKVSGSRFGYLLGDMVKLELGLLQFAIDVLTDSKIIKKIIKKNKLSVSGTAFIPVLPPVLVKKEMMVGMGYVERGEDEIYYLEKDNLYLIATSEQSIGPMHSGEILLEENLPRRYVGFSTCFRREAGSYGKDTKGILRVHQFDKSEMFSITKPELAAEEHKLLLAIEEYLMQQLELRYRVLDICTGDLGDPAAAKYDIETWMPGENDGKGNYRETHSTSNTTDFQSRRLNIRFKNKDGKSEYVYMLNGTVFSGRPMIAILENYQQKDGSIKVPKVLQKYVGKKIIG